MTVRGTFFVTPRAVEDLLAIRGWADTESNYLKAEKYILAMSEDAHLVLTQDNGLEQWRVGRRRGRLRFLASWADRAEGDLPQIVRVLPSSAKK